LYLSALLIIARIRKRRTEQKTTKCGFERILYTVREKEQKTKENKFGNPILVYARLMIQTVKHNTKQNKRNQNKMTTTTTKK